MTHSDRPQKAQRLAQQILDGEYLEDPLLIARRILDHAEALAAATNAPVHILPPRYHLRGDPQ